MPACSNCPRDHGEGSILCPWCQALYFKGQPVQGRGRIIQNFDGPPKGWVPPDDEQMDLFKEQAP